MANHTPGPWSYHTWNASGKQFGIETADHKHGIAAVTPNVNASTLLTMEQHEANARLIAAAPDMLAALQGLNHMGGDDRGCYCICPCNDGSAPSHKHSTACRDARIAIAAATGESINGLEF